MAAWGAELQAAVSAARAGANAEGDVSLWDIAPFPVLLEEAGARFTDLTGIRRWPSRTGIAAAPALHEAALAALAYNVRS